MIHAVPKPAKRGPKERAPRKQKTRMKQRNAKRGGHMFPKNVDEARREFIRSLPCVLQDRVRLATEERLVPMRSHYCTSPSRACHLKNRGAGGKDAGNMFPGCDSAHQEQHCIGIPKFQERWGVDLAAECARREAEYLVAAPSPDPRL